MIFEIYYRLVTISSLFLSSHAFVVGKRRAVEKLILPSASTLSSKPFGSSISRKTESISSERQDRSMVVLDMAGFGGGSEGAKSKKEQAAKIKPKAQWDRYIKLKKDLAVRVAVRIVGKEDEDWIVVGKVKSKGNGFTEIAVARQRALIADHARRLFPLEVSSKDTIEWARESDDKQDDWVVVDKSILDGDVPKGIEKKIGFEGRADPATGYYCKYNEGRLVNNENEQLMTRPGSKKLK